MTRKTPAQQPDQQPQETETDNAERVTSMVIPAHTATEIAPGITITLVRDHPTEVIVRFSPEVANLLEGWPSGDTPDE